MSPAELKLTVADATPAVLTLPQPVNAQTVQALERALAGTLGMLRRDLGRAAVLESADSADAAARTASRQTAGEIEYASWLPDAAALEYASWMAQLLTARR